MAMTRGWRAGAALMTGTLLLAGCNASRREASPPAVSVVKPQAPPPAETAILAGADDAATAEMIWSLRGGLNVAAIQCNNRALADDYNQILKRHRSVLNVAYAAEQARYAKQHGKAGIARHDTDMTRLYNRFANLPNKASYCRDAERLAAEIVALPSERLPAVARRALARLDPAAPAIINAAR